MRYYCGLDLGARYCQVCVIDEKKKQLVNKKVDNDLSTILALVLWVAQSTVLLIDFVSKESSTKQSSVGIGASHCARKRLLRRASTPSSQ